MANPILPGSKLYGVEDKHVGSPKLVEVEVSEVLPKQVRLEEGTKLFDQTYLSKYDPRISQIPIKAIKAYIVRKKRRSKEMNDKKKILNQQIFLAKEMMGKYK